jgi:hypothetical protein
MIPTGATLDAAATGIYDGYYVSAARVPARTRPDAQGIIRIRPGWELNGDWFRWAAERHFASRLIDVAPCCYAAFPEHL